MRPDAAGALASLTRIARRYAPGLGARKRALLLQLASSKLASASQVRRLHEILSFLAAYPDDGPVRQLALRLLHEFRRRSDLRKHRAALAGSGIAGTDIPYRFFWPTALWLSSEWPGSLELDRSDQEAAGAIMEALPQLLEPAQSEWLQSHRAPTLARLDELRPPGITDADYFISLVAAMPGDDFSREAFFDRLDPSFILRAGDHTPERTTDALQPVATPVSSVAAEGHAAPAEPGGAPRTTPRRHARGPRRCCASQAGPHLHGDSRTRPRGIPVRESARCIHGRRWRRPGLCHDRHATRASRDPSRDLRWPDTAERRSDRVHTG